MRTSQSVVTRRDLELSTRGPVHIRIIRQDENGSQVECSINYEKADVPERAYYADYCDVAKGRFGYDFVFGRLVPGQQRLRTKIEIAFPEDMFQKQLWGSSRQFHATLGRLVAGQSSERISPDDTDKVQTFSANNVFMATGTEEAILDFYYISPADLSFFGQGKKTEIALQPVIRVVLATGLMFEFLEKCGVFATNLPESTLRAEGK
jgi:hypothetical protein